jgi:hypothetical protein
VTLKSMLLSILCCCLLTACESKKDDSDDDGDGDEADGGTIGGGGGGGGGEDCTNDDVIRNVTSPFDFGASTGFYGFGVHGSANNHPEGHPGLDFFFDTAMPVKAPFAGVVEDVFSSGHGDAMCLDIRHADGCNTAIYCGLDVASGIAQGVAVNDGDVVGTAHLYESDQGETSTMHIGFRATTADEFPLCTAEWLNTEEVRCVIGTTAGQTDPTDCSTVPLRAGGTLMRNSEGFPAGSRTVTCADGTSMSYEAPQEDGICNGPLDPALKAQIFDCVGLPEGRWN